MKIVRAQDKFVCQLAAREKQVLFDLLNLYPRIPPGHYQEKTSEKKAAIQPSASQRLLDEALASQRAENRKHVQDFLTDTQRCLPMAGGWRMSLSSTELEWLLQILNDVRVGSWILLGSPDDQKLLAMFNEKTAPDFLAMEMAGHFEMQMLKALEGL